MSSMLWWSSCSIRAPELDHNATGSNIRDVPEPIGPRSPWAFSWPPVSTTCPRPPAGDREPDRHDADMQFTPSHVTIEAGDTVTWVWDDGSMPHDVSGDGYGSEVKSRDRTFDDPGDYPYVCTLHAGMSGAVTVER